MPQVDLSITISVIIAIAAIISPILTARINNRHQFKLRKLELDQQSYEHLVLQEKEIYYAYLSATSKLIHLVDRDNLKNYSEYYPLVLVRVNQELSKDLELIDSLVQGDMNVREQALTTFNSLVPKIKAVIDKLSSQDQ